jgi:hypothetical protein
MTAADTTTLMHWEVIVICNNSLCVLGKFSRYLRLCRTKAIRASPPDQIYLAKYIASDPCVEIFRIHYFYTTDRHRPKWVV